MMRILPQFLSVAWLMAAPSFAAPFDSLESLCKGRDQLAIEKHVVRLEDFWTTEQKIKSDIRSGRVGVFQISNWKGVSLALFKTLREMNLVLGRPTTYLMENHKMRTHESVLNPQSDDPGYKEIIGHDLQASLLTAFLEDFEKVETRFTLPTSSHRYDLCEEREFWLKFLKDKIDDANFVLIAASLEYATVATVSHELHHAFFYRMPELRRAVGHYWDYEVSSRDQKKIKEVLKQYGYDVDANHEMLLNEFLAYLLQQKADVDILHAFYPTHAKELRAHLESAGVFLPQV
jgi:hypothetical protein